MTIVVTGLKLIGVDRTLMGALYIFRIYEKRNYTDITFWNSTDATTIRFFMKTRIEKNELKGYPVQKLSLYIILC